MARWCVVAAVASLAASATSCHRAPDRPSILIIVIDSLRADRLHHAGDSRPLSPGLDRFATEASRFTRAYASAPWTTPSVMSLFTGLAPTTHHVDSNDHQLDASVRTLAERLQQAGYRTGAVMPALTLADHFGFGRGFDKYVLEVQGHGGISGPWSVQQATSFLRQAGQPFFLYVHFWDVHYNYNPPVPEALRFEAGRPAGPGETDDVTALIDFSGHADAVQSIPADRVAWLEGQYAGEVLFTDGQVARLLETLERLKLAENTIVVITADHGEAFQEHGILGHTVHLYDEVQHVPLLVRWPDRVPAGRELGRPIGLTDVAPTLLDLVGLPFDVADFDGRSRAEVLLGGAERAPAKPVSVARDGASTATGGDDLNAPPDAALLVATSRRARLRGLISAETAYIYDFDTGRDELYDLVQDPGQQHNLAAVRPEVASLWRRRLCDRLARLLPRGEIPAVLLPAEVRAVLDAGLAQLGYLGRDEHDAVDDRPFASQRDDPAAERQGYLDALGCTAAGG